MNLNKQKASWYMRCQVILKFNEGGDLLLDEKWLLILGFHVRGHSKLRGQNDWQTHVDTRDIHISAEVIIIREKSGACIAHTSDICSKKKRNLLCRLIQ